ncbi:MAG: hypothetical protein ACRDHY_07380, partial [Anaerolineales bacterium]
LRAELRREWQADLRAELDARFASVDERFAMIDARLNKVDDRFTRIEEQIRDAKVSTIRWMFGFWIGTGAMVMGWFITRWLTT